MNATVEERFWAKVDKSGECWEWTAGKAKGYGYFYIDRTRTLAHRTAYALTVEALPSSIHLDHICHNTSCVNPSHLRPVTRKENMENRRGPIANSKSGFRGVSMHKTSGLWQAKVGHNGKQIHLGYFKDPAAAGAVAQAKRNELFTHNSQDLAA